MVGRPETGTTTCASNILSETQPGEPRRPELRRGKYRIKTDPEREIEVQFMDFIDLSQNDGLGKLYQLEMVPNSIKGVIVVLSYSYGPNDYKRLLLMIKRYQRLFEGDLLK